MKGAGAAMRVSCLLCGRSLESFHVFPRKALFTKPLERAEPDAVADMALVYCPECRHVSSRLESRMSADLVHAKTYSELYKNFAPTGLSGMQKGYTDFVGKWLADWLPAASDVLEIGCHDGYMLKLLQDRGHRTEGVEPSPFADYANVTYGLHVRKGFYASGDYKPASFDMVIVRHVVEHVADPVAFVQDAVKVLKPGGLFYVEVPNSQWSLEEAYFPEFHADHISYFSMASLLRLLERTGLRDVRHAEAVNAYMRFPFLNVMARKAEGVGVGQGSHRWFMDFRISEAIDRFGTKYASYMDTLRRMKGDRDLGVWGAGSIGIQYAIDAGWGLNDVTYVDKNPANQGLVLSVTGHRVHAPEVLRERGGRCLLIASGWEEDVRRQAQEFLAPKASVVVFADLLAGRL